MKILKNSYARYDIAPIHDRFQKGKKSLGGIAGYNRFTGWILSLFGFAVKLKGDKGTVYLNRKSAIHWINRHGFKLNEKTKGAEIRARIDMIIRGLSLITPLREKSPPPPTAPKQDPALKTLDKNLIVAAFNKCKNEKNALDNFFKDWSGSGLENMRYLLAQIPSEDLDVVISPELFKFGTADMAQVDESNLGYYLISRPLVADFFNLLNPIQQNWMIEIFEERDWDRTLLRQVVPTAEVVEIFKRYRQSDMQVKKFCWFNPKQLPRDKAEQDFRAVLAEMTVEEFKHALDGTFFGTIDLNLLVPYLNLQPEKIALVKG